MASTLSEAALLDLSVVFELFSLHSAASVYGMHRFGVEKEWPWYTRIMSST